MFALVAPLLARLRRPQHEMCTQNANEKMVGQEVSNEELCKCVCWFRGISPLIARFGFSRSIYIRFRVPDAGHGTGHTHEAAAGKFHEKT